MKNLGFLITGLLFGTQLMAQDTLYTVIGEKQCVKVLEVTPTDIKYKKTSNLEGPVYTVNKNSIALVEYKNGSKEVYGTGSTPSDPSQVNNPNNPASVNNYYNQYPYWGGPRIRVVWAAPAIYASPWVFNGHYRPRHHSRHSTYHYGRRH